MRTAQRTGSFGGGLTGPVQRDLLVLLGIVLATFALQFFAATAPLMDALRLTPRVWAGWVWQLATYPFVAVSAGGLWLVVELAVLFLFGRDVLAMLGRRRFWRLLLEAVGAAGVVAVLTALLTGWLGVESTTVLPFIVMQGQRTLIAVLVAAFAALHRDATILLFFVLPIEARWVVALEVLLAFLSGLQYHDLPGFVGLLTAIGVSYYGLSRGGLVGAVQRFRLRLHERWLRLRLAWRRRRYGIRAVKDEERVRRGPWVH